MDEQEWDWFAEQATAGEVDHLLIGSSVPVLSGDVHYSYLAQAKIKNAAGNVYQAVYSPIRNPLSRLLRLGNGC